MLAYVIDAARGVAERPLVVISPASEAARQVFGESVEWVVQDPPQGTGDALQVALTAMTGEPDEIVVLSGDTPLLTGVTVRRLVDRRRTTKAAVALATMTPEDATVYGRVVRRCRPK